MTSTVILIARQDHRHTFTLWYIHICEQHNKALKRCNEHTSTHHIAPYMLQDVNTMQNKHALEEEYQSQLLNHDYICDMELSNYS